MRDTRLPLAEFLTKRRHAVGIAVLRQDPRLLVRARCMRASKQFVNHRQRDSRPFAPLIGIGELRFVRVASFLPSR